MRTAQIQTYGILKNLHSVLQEAKCRYSQCFDEQEVKLNDEFKFAYQNYLTSKNWTVRFFDYTTVVSSASGNSIYIANQWFVIASYFVDFCAEMRSYRELFVEICRELGFETLGSIKTYAVKLRSAPSESDKCSFLVAAKQLLLRKYPNIQDDYDKVSLYLWKFASEYSWWAGNKTIDRHDFYVSALLSQMNVVNANSEYLAIICDSFASELTLRILVEDLSGFTKDVYLKKEALEMVLCESDPIEYGEIHVSAPRSKGISISAASLQRFKNK